MSLKCCCSAVPISTDSSQNETCKTGMHPVCLSKNITKDETGQLMLFNTSVLEYNGLDRWNYPNPAVRQSALFQTALDDLLAQNA